LVVVDIVFDSLIIPSRWVRKWLLHAHYKVCDAPGRIDMYPLLQQDDTVEGGWRPKNTLQSPLYSNDPNVEDHPGHYRYFHRYDVLVWAKAVHDYVAIVSVGEYRWKLGCALWICIMFRDMLLLWYVAIKYAVAELLIVDVHTVSMAPRLMT
jgi:hypothetical protein